MSEKTSASKSFIQQFEPLLENAVAVIKEMVEGRQVNPERLKTAKFVITSYKSGEIIDKEKRIIGLNERRFNFNVLENFGSDEQKAEVKKVIQKSLSNLKFLE